MIETQTLPPGADLKGAMVTMLARYVTAGWNLEEYSWRSSTSFINRDKDQYMVAIRPTDPAKPLEYNSLSMEGTVKR